jgi:hypothetical protein
MHFDATQQNYRNDISFWGIDTFRQSSMRRNSPTVESLSHHKDLVLGLRYDSPAVESLSHHKDLVLGLRYDSPAVESLSHH